MQDEQARKIDEMRADLSQAMSKELEKMRKQSLVDLEGLRQSVENHVSHLDSNHQSRQTEEQGARVAKLQVDLQETLRAQRVAEEEASGLRVRLASAEERAKMLQTRQEELRKERVELDDERRTLRLQSEQQWQKLSAAESELHKLRAEAEAQRTELVRLNATKAQDAENVSKERDVWKNKEQELQQEIAELRGQLEDTRSDSEVQALKAEGEQREVVAQLRLHVEKLECEAATRTEQLTQQQQLRLQLDAERNVAQQREDALKRQGALELRRCEEELEEARAREAELMHMLNEVQDGIIIASSGGP